MYYPFTTYFYFFFKEETVPKFNFPRKTSNSSSSRTLHCSKPLNRIKFQNLARFDIFQLELAIKTKTNASSRKKQVIWQHVAPQEPYIESNDLRCETTRVPNLAICGFFFRTIFSIELTTSGNIPKN